MVHDITVSDPQQVAEDTLPLLAELEVASTSGNKQEDVTAGASDEDYVVGENEDPDIPTIQKVLDEIQQVEYDGTVEEGEVRTLLTSTYADVADQRQHKQIASRQQVFETTELLEQILLLLPIKDLLLDQRVCTTWKNCIGNSIRLQQGLFMRPAGKMTVEKYATDLRAMRTAGGKYESRYCVSTRTCFLNQLMVNKLGHKRIGQLIVGELNEAMDVERQIALRSKRKRLERKRLECKDVEYDAEIVEQRGIHYPQASWRLMSATQPPLPAFGLTTSSRPHAHDAQYGFYEMIAEAIVEQIQLVVTAQDVQVLETGVSASDEEEGGEFMLSFDKHAAEDWHRVDRNDSPLWVRVGRETVRTSRPSDALKLVARYD